MTETVKTKETTRLCRKIKRLQDSLLLSIDSFRKGNDSVALESFRNSIENLQDILDVYVCLGEPDGMIKEALPAIRTLDKYIDNQDCIGVADTLEFTVYPLTNNWLERQLEQ